MTTVCGEAGQRHRLPVDREPGNRGAKFLRARQRVSVASRARRSAVPWFPSGADDARRRDRRPLRASARGVHRGTKRARAPAAARRSPRAGGRGRGTPQAVALGLGRQPAGARAPRGGARAARSSRRDQARPARRRRAVSRGGGCAGPDGTRAALFGRPHAVRHGAPGGSDDPAGRGGRRVRAARCGPADARTRIERLRRGPGGRACPARLAATRRAAGRPSARRPCRGREARRELAELRSAARERRREAAAADREAQRAHDALGDASGAWTGRGGSPHCGRRLRGREARLGAARGRRPGVTALAVACACVAERLERVALER